MNEMPSECLPVLPILVRKLHPSAILPARKTDQAAGWDLHAIEETFVFPDDRKTLKTGIALAIPAGYYGHICDRSGLAMKNGITVIGGIIDSDYRGEIHIILHNLDNLKTLQIHAGDRIAQIIFRRHYDAVFSEVEELPETERGEKGLGHTGM